MQQIVNELYGRIGQYLKPDVRSDVVMESDGRPKYKIVGGRCKRTGLNGPIVPYEEHHHGIVIIPTHPKLLWMFAFQSIPKSTGELITQRLGGVKNQIIVVAKDRLLTNVAFCAPIPKLEIMKTPALLRLLAEGILGEFVFLSFAKSTEKVFGNDFRRSIDNTIEVNGELNFGSKDHPLVITNAAISLGAACQLATCGVAIEHLFKLHGPINNLGLSDNQQTKLREMVADYNVPDSVLRLLRRIERRDIIFAAKMIDRDDDKEEKP